MLLMKLVAWVPQPNRGSGEVVDRRAAAKLDDAAYKALQAAGTSNALPTAVTTASGVG
jgi:hypothetical protein